MKTLFYASLLALELSLSACSLPIGFLSNPPATPSFTYSYGNRRYGATPGYALSLENTSTDTEDVSFEFEVSEVGQDIGTNHYFYTDTMPRVVTLRATRDNITRLTQQVVHYTPPPPEVGFDIVQGSLYSMPPTRPDGTAWINNSTALPSDIYLMGDYHGTMIPIDGNNLPSTQIMGRIRYSGFGPGNITTLIGPNLNNSHPVSLVSNGDTLYSFNFVPNDFRYPNSDSGKVVLEEAGIKLALWLKFKG